MSYSRYMSKSSHRQPPDSRNVGKKADSASQKKDLGKRRRPLGERGRRRRDLILDTAADLLTAGGPEAINTNALAERAGISVGSVYQYFSNKEAILMALGQRYMEQLASNTVAALQQDVSGLDFETMVNRVIDPMIAFERQHPAFGHMSGSPEVSPTLGEGAKHIDQEILTTIHGLLLRVSPNLPDERAWHMARVTKAMYKGMSYLIQQEQEIIQTGGNADSLLADMKRMMAHYLETELSER